MRHLKSGRKLSRRKEHRSAMLANLASSLIKHGSVRTTDVKAKEIRPFVEKMVTFARRGDLHARRIVRSRLRDPLAVKKLFDEIGPQYKSRPGGYTRIIKLGFRLGDNSPISLIQFIKEEKTKKVSTKGKSKKTKTKPAQEVVLPSSKKPEAITDDSTEKTDSLESLPAETVEDKEKKDLVEETGEKPEAIIDDSNNITVDLVSEKKEPEPDEAEMDSTFPAKEKENPVEDQQDSSQVEEDS